MTNNLIIAGARFRHRAAEVKAARDEKLYNDIYQSLSSGIDPNKLKQELEALADKKQKLLNLNIYKRA